MRRPIVLKEAKRIYIAAGGPSDHSDKEWGDIRDEIERICAAKSARGAARIVSWWGCWDRAMPATAFCRRVRELAGVERS